MDDIINLTTVGVSVAALIVSIVSLLISKRKIITGTITENRMQWIAEMRELMKLFLMNYIRQKGKTKLKIIKSKIDLYIVYDKKYYQEFEQKLNYCIENPYTESDCRKLIELCQKVLNDSWNRTKIEAGVSDRAEKKIEKSIRAKEES